jgi:hypothetical protein
MKSRKYNKKRKTNKTHKKQTLYYSKYNSKYNETIKKYLEDVILYSQKKKEQISINEFLSNGNTSFLHSESTVMNMFEKYNKEFAKDKDAQDNWTICKKECTNILLPLISEEINSTAYILRTLSKHIINTDKKRPYIIYFVFSCSSNDKLTGIWENDKQYFNIKFGPVPKENSLKTEKEETVSRLIMSFGPSASGKTRSGKYLISLLNSVDSTFPKSFMTIDGGNYREDSFVYNIILKALSRYKYTGFNNLVSQSVYGSLFDSFLVKNTIIDYLSTQKEKQKKNLQISLYIPETSMSCKTQSLLYYKPCSRLIQKYLSIVDTKLWSSFVIWQHKTGEECTFSKGFKCKGCLESGSKREKTEGKKYTNKEWNFSMNQGMIDMLTATEYKLLVHNSGGKENSKTLIHDYSNNKYKLIHQPKANNKKLFKLSGDKIFIENIEYNIFDIKDFPEFVYI